jgi:hypothetical protein
MARDSRSPAATQARFAAGVSTSPRLVSSSQIQVSRSAAQ